MTCVAGVVDEGIVYMGADSAGVAGFDLVVRADGKLFRRGDFLIGFCGSFRIGQLLRYRLKLPVHQDGVDVHEFMATQFVDSVRECLREGGCERKRDEVVSGGTFLVGYRSRLFQIESDYQVGEAAAGIDAVGCGAPAALGAMSALRDVNALRGPNLVHAALQAAERLNAGVRGPFQVQALIEGARP